MANVVLVSCGKHKLDHSAKAAELYIGPLFTASMQYARTLNPDRIFILSAKHGLLGLETVIEPYDVTLDGKDEAVQKAWAKKVLARLASETSLTGDRFTILAGENYYKYLTPHLRTCEIPMRGLTIEEQLQFLRARLRQSA